MKHIFLASFLSWLIPFVISFLIFPIREQNVPLFESLIAVTLACTAVGLGAWLKTRQDFTVVQGLMIGGVWMLLNVTLDYLIFVRGPVQMELEAYIYDIGVAYFMFPLVLGLIGGLARHLPTEVDA